MCIRRYYLEEGMLALFVSHDALLPEDDERFDNLDVCKLHERVFRFGFGVKERRKVPVVKRNVYRNNCGVRYPLDNFHELVVAAVLHKIAQSQTMPFVRPRFCHCQNAPAGFEQW